MDILAAPLGYMDVQMLYQAFSQKTMAAYQLRLQNTRQVTITAKDNHYSAAPIMNSLAQKP